MSRHVLLTGATGFLGGELLDRFVARGDRVTALTRRPLERPAHPQVHTLMGDLTGPLDVSVPEDVDLVVHCAASVAFDPPIEEQRAINVQGTQRVLELAARLPHLERFVHVSTAYVAGTHVGEAGPDHVGTAFRNAYEQSKAEAESHVRASGLPVQVVRPSVVVGDSRTGRTAAFNVMYVPLRAFSRGLLTVVPGLEDAPVDVVPVDYVADGIVRLLLEPAGGTHQLVAGPTATTVGELIALGSARFGGAPPQVVDPGTLSDEVPALVPYFSVQTHFRDSATHRLLGAPPVLRDYFDTLMDHADEQEWGRKRRRAA